MMAGPVRTLTIAAVLLATVLAFGAPTVSAADFEINDIAVVDTDFLNVRSDAGTDGRILTVIGNGLRLLILDGPRDDDGLTWYEVQGIGDSDEDPIVGWVASDYIVAEAGSGDDFESARWVEVIDGPVNMRDEAGLDGNVVDTLATGETSDVAPVADLQTADGFIWLRLSQDGGETGWVATDFLSSLATDPGSEPGTVGFEDAQGVRIVDGPVNIRQGAGLDQTVIGVRETGAEFPVNVGASQVVSSDGYDWIAVLFGIGIPGYIAVDFLEPLSSSPNLGSSDVLTGFTDVDAAVVTDGPLYLRAEPDSSGDILLTLENGDYLWIAQPVIENTATVDGIFWIAVSVAGEDGWVAIEFVSPAE